jgi:hypothetical protein
MNVRPSDRHEFVASFKADGSAKPSSILDASDFMRFFSSKRHFSTDNLSSDMTSKKTNKPYLFHADSRKLESGQYRRSD